MATTVPKKGPNLASKSANRAIARDTHNQRATVCAVCIQMQKGSKGVQIGPL